ncbi:hypothetical protein KAFR_0I02930 [Kazachstania africana CBS 2517]|uniref:Peroxisomal membrane protein PEX11 n=1 Tax=Kazachstania africana (strain ATCC 22294 / BCRC 22015 / CBS 2517 / CECT 1963 / NBRC 1671 / NRRL Y-8276) TaxID=1071382 RepID=H2B0C2_KAZAF|nr:hypothetical protein KAFR_0I02930 [Kazachstania africana CBS 2517]CCF60072.1 hypothetical protein KAFR_0I02930 [Kazachstania africana CBS 2517]
MIDLTCYAFAHNKYVSTTVRFLETVNGREKVLRLLQFSLRFISSISLFPILADLQAEINIVRKFLRFLKPIQNLQIAAKFYSNDSLADGATIRCLNIIRNLLFGVYLGLDQINLLRILKVLPTTLFYSKTVPFYTNLFWLLSLFCAISIDVLHVIMCCSSSTNKPASAKDIDDDKNLKAVKASMVKKRKVYVRKWLWDVMDTIIVLNFLQFVNNGDRLVGLLGMVTSWYGIQDVWGDCFYFSN